MFDLAEVFGHGAGVAAILLTAWVLAPEQRRQLPRVICCAYGAGLAADGMKLLLSRGRPYKTDLSSITSVWQTFPGWFPLFSSGSAGQSFTSAHTATAVGLALGLAVDISPREMAVRAPSQCWSRCSGWLVLIISLAIRCGARRSAA